MADIRIFAWQDHEGWHVQPRGAEEHLYKIFFDPFEAGEYAQLLHDQYGWPFAPGIPNPWGDA